MALSSSSGSSTESSGPLSSAYRSVCDDYRASSVQLASQVHKVIRDGDYAWLPDLVTDNRILWEANASGWTAVHYAASHFLPYEWWKWILQRACDNYDRLRTARNNLGETVLDIFFRSFMAPLPWQANQVKNCSRLLLQSMRQVRRDAELLRQTRDILEHSASEGEAQQNNNSSLSCFPASTNISVVRCVCFCRSLSLLCQAAETGTLSGSYPFVDVLSFLAEMGGCPEPFCRLALAMYHPQSDQQEVRSSYDGSLLCSWSASPVPFCPVMDGMQQPLLEAFPEAASTLDDESGRYPLHHALASGRLWQDVQMLFDAHPPVLEMPDPITGLFPFALLASSLSADDHSWEEAIEIRARRDTAGEKGLSSLWYIMPATRRAEAIRRATVEMECERLASVYLALRAFPRALPTPDAGNVSSSEDRTST